MTAPTIGEIRNGSVLAPDGHWHPVAIEEFKGTLGFLSNFARAPFTWGGRTYPTVEHAFQCMKTVDARQREWVLSAPTPTEAKARGRKVQIRDGWDEIRHQVMTEAVRAKFTNPHLANLLVETGDRLLVEGNTWHDNVWGDCFCGRPACAAEGQNHLGKILMQIRYELGRQRVQAAKGQQQTQHAGQPADASPDADLEIPPAMLNADPESRGRILDTIPSRIREIRSRFALNEQNCNPEQVDAEQLRIAARLEDVAAYKRAAMEALSEAEEIRLRAYAAFFDRYAAECEATGARLLPEYRQKAKADLATAAEREDVRRCKLALAYIEDRSKVLSKQLTLCQSLAKSVTAASGGGRWSS
ncbi:NADAR family protein [Frankia sp. R82]|uniref:NADAR family protein n=1 Tax=Frankia sp. R82 TaxID=2950553 RepID=UPI00204384AA|nr:NADAR family protein [Frankia sp. R82]MCM3884178.1 NADAR family protein [Frankia sp. R82]